MKGLFKKFMEFGIGSFAVLIIGLISTPIVTRLVNPIEYGKANMFVTVSTLIILILTFGMDQVFVRYYNEEEVESRSTFLLKTIKVPVILNIVVGIILVFLYKFVSNKIVGEESLIIMILLLIHCTLRVISNFALLNIRMKQKGKLYSLLNVLNKFAFLGCVVVGYFYFKNSYMTIVVATVISNLVIGLVAVLSEYKDWNILSKKIKIKITTKEMFNYGLPFVFSMGLTWIFQSIDRLSIVYFGEYSKEAFFQAGLYSGAMSIITLLSTFQGAFTTFWVPVAYEKYSENPNDIKFFNNVSEIVSIAMIILSIGLIALKDVLIYFLGKEYNGVQFIFPFLVLMPIMYTISETTCLGINFKKKTKYHIYIALLAAITNIIGNVLLVPVLGAKGAAISTGLAYVVFFAARTYYGNMLYSFGFKWSKISISVGLVYGLAAYSSVFKFNFNLCIITIIIIGIVLFIYKDTIIMVCKVFKKYRNK